MKAASLSTQRLKQYREKGKADGVSETTCNRELSILRIALNLGRKCTPAKVLTMPFFPNIVDIDDIKSAREMMQKRRKDDE